MAGGAKLVEEKQNAHLENVRAVFRQAKEMGIPRERLLEELDEVYKEERHD